MSGFSLKTAALAFLPALSIAACDTPPANNAPPASVTVATPDWVGRFDATGRKRRCRLTDTQTGETYRLHRRGGKITLNDGFMLDARRRQCVITETATGITCTFQGYSGRVSRCTAPNPLATHPTAHAVSGNMAKMIAAAS